MAPKVTQADILDALRADLEHRGRPEGEEWMTIPEMVATLNKQNPERPPVSDSMLRKMVAKKVQAGILEQRRGTLADDRGVERAVNYFRAKP